MRIKISKSQWKEMGREAGWTKEALVKHIDLCIQKLNVARHEIDTGVDPKYVVFNLKDEIAKIIQSMSDFTEV